MEKPAASKKPVVSKPSSKKPVSKPAVKKPAPKMAAAKKPVAKQPVKKIVQQPVKPKAPSQPVKSAAPAKTINREAEKKVTGSGIAFEKKIDDLVSKGASAEKSAETTDTTARCAQHARRTEWQA